MSIARRVPKTNRTAHRISSRECSSGLGGLLHLFRSDLAKTKLFAHVRPGRPERHLTLCSLCIIVLHSHLKEDSGSKLMPRFMISCFVTLQDVSKSRNGPHRAGQMCLPAEWTSNIVGHLLAAQLTLKLNFQDSFWVCGPIATYRFGRWWFLLVSSHLNGVLRICFLSKLQGYCQKRFIYKSQAQLDCAIAHVAKQVEFFLKRYIKCKAAQPHPAADGQWCGAEP